MPSDTAAEKGEDGPESRVDADEQQAKEAASLDAETTYEVVRREGMGELERTTGALLWSGLAGGLSMGFSFVAEALLRAHLPEAEWRPLITKLGYSVGFIIVIVGSQQLFTENTLTPIIPLLHRWTRDRLRNVMRLWSAVLISNLVGAFLFALALGWFKVVEPEVKQAMSAIAAESMKHDAWTTMLHAVFAGWLIALMVWMLPGAESSKLVVIIMMTYLVGLAGFAHIIAGAVEVFYAGVLGEAGAAQIFGGFLLPTLIGNVAGGLTMVAALNHAQATSGE